MKEELNEDAIQPLKIHSSLTRGLEELKPLDGKTVRLYTCGPSVYNFAHIGNFRAYMFEDVLRRAIKLNGWGVKQVMNLTDVDDKTIRGANAGSIPLNEYTKPYKEAFFRDLETLNIEKAEVYPAATDHIPEMISLVQKLFEKGVAYKSDDGSVYFSVEKFPQYGQLAHIDRENMRTGARCASDEYEKENVGDFALWKAWEESDGPVGWESPWGLGRPGWHIECSAMSMKYLGETFDLHTGGIDNMFPHHENEIAQAEAATGKKFVVHWMHCAHLRVNGEKMSKSLGNFYTLRDLLDKGFTGREIRYVLASAHYRQPLNFTFSALEDARKALKRIDNCISSLSRKASEGAAATPSFAQTAWIAFMNAVNDDLNLPKAYAALFECVHAANAALETMSGDEAAAVLGVFKKMDSLFGFIFNSTAPADEDVPDEIKAVLAERAEARKAKNWAESDRLRNHLASLGWTVKDSKDGQTVSKA